MSEEAAKVLLVELMRQAKLEHGHAQAMGDDLAMVKLDGAFDLVEAAQVIVEWERGPRGGAEREEPTDER